MNESRAEGTLDLQRPEVKSALAKYWSANIRTMLVLLVIWAVAGLGAGVLIADWLNQFYLFGSGFPLGFWFAHQGSIIVFVFLILIYCIQMNRLDARHRDALRQTEE